MNRRGFLASAIAAVLAPKELIAPSEDLVCLSERSLEQMLQEMMLNGSSLNRISIKPTRLIVSSEWAKVLRPQLERIFDESYTTVDWNYVFRTRENLQEDFRIG